MLPFKIKFTRHLKTAIRPGEELRAMEVVKEIMQRVGADEIEVRGSDLVFKHDIFGKLTLGALSGLNAGEIYIQVNPADSTISYEFNTAHLHIFIVIFIIAGFFAAPKWWMGCVAAVTLLGVNTLFLCLRQRRLFRDIILAIHYPEILHEEHNRTAGNN